MAEDANKIRAELSRELLERLGAMAEEFRSNASVAIEPGRREAWSQAAQRLQDEINELAT